LLNNTSDLSEVSMSMLLSLLKKGD